MREHNETAYSHLRTSNSGLWFCEKMWQMVFSSWLLSCKSHECCLEKWYRQESWIKSCPKGMKDRRTDQKAQIISSLCLHNTDEYCKRDCSSQNVWFSLFGKAIFTSWKKSTVFGKVGQFHRAISLCNSAMLFSFLLVCSAGLMVS